VIKAFWTCFRQDLDLNFQSPSITAIFPPFSAVFPPFSAVFSPLNFLFFLVDLCSFHDNVFCCIHLRCLLERCCKCQNATRNSSETAFSGAIAMPPVLDDVALLRFGIGFADTLCSQVLKSRQLTLCHLPIVEQSRKEKKDHYLVVSTPLKNISQWEGLSHMYPYVMENKTCSKPPTK